MQNPIVLLEKGARATAHLVGHLVENVSDVDAVYQALTPEAKAALVRTLGDILHFVAALEGAAGSRGMNFVLDEQVLSIARNLYNDARLDKETAIAVFKALKISLPAEVKPTLKAA